MWAVPTKGKQKRNRNGHLLFTFVLLIMVYLKLLPIAQTMVSNGRMIRE
jgi:hypothetical protein